MEIRSIDIRDVEEVMNKSQEAFNLFRKTSPQIRADFLDRIADEIEALGDELIHQATAESNLPYQRLLGERGRTTSQLRSFAAMVREGSWADASIDTAIPDRKPLAKPDIRKMMIPLGPVIVFGASNFPFAYSTAGGDTASALAAGCSVIVKAHQAHAKTSEMVASAIRKAILASDMPENVFQHVHGSGREIGKALVQHPLTTAVGFTGSYTGGRALYDYASERKNLIPVFSEMGSTNPVVFLPDTLKKNAEDLATQYAGSVTQSVGQFCTNPGILFGIKSEELDHFSTILTEKVNSIAPSKMLYENIHRSYCENRQKMLDNNSVKVLQEPSGIAGEMEGQPTIALTDGKTFLKDTYLKEEVFGPFSLIVACENIEELMQAWKSVSGQLTTSIMATDEDLTQFPGLTDFAETVAGRVIYNGIPTGVEVCPSMVHGGPYPATTDSRFTAVGLQSVKRWIRPVCYQNSPAHLLPAELQDDNPRNIWRLVNNNWTKEAVKAGGNQA